MKGFDREGIQGPKKPLPDSVAILDPPVEKAVNEPSSDHREPAVVHPPAEEAAAFQQTEAVYEPAADYQTQTVF